MHCQFANSGKPELASRNDAVKGSSIRRCRGIECGRVQAGDVVSKGGRSVERAAAMCAWVTSSQVASGGKGGAAAAAAAAVVAAAAAATVAAAASVAGGAGMGQKVFVG